MEICFVPDKDYGKFLRDSKLATNHKGDIVDPHGRKLGDHDPAPQGPPDHFRERHLDRPLLGVLTLIPSARSAFRPVLGVRLSHRAHLGPALFAGDVVLRARPKRLCQKSC